MRIKKKELSILLTIVVIGAALIFAGCSSDPSSDSPQKNYTVTVSGAQNGSITADPKTNVAAGTPVTLTINPESGYRLKSGSLSVKRTNGTTVSVNASDNTRTFIMPASNVTVSGEFELPVGKSYDITVASSIENGAITANPSSTQEGITVTLTISPDPNYQYRAVR